LDGAREITRLAGSGSVIVRPRPSVEEIDEGADTVSVVLETAGGF
jgi:hypothetical protein